MKRDLRPNPYRKSKCFTDHHFPRKYQLKRRVKRLERAIRSLMKDMRDPEMIEKYQAILDENPTVIYDPERRSEYLGVQHFQGQRGRPWWVGMVVKDGKQYKKYFREEIDAALYHDEMILKHNPTAVDYLNFIPEGWDAKDCIRKPNTHEKRKFISRFADPSDVKKVNPAGLPYITVDEADALIEYIEQTTDASLIEWHKQQK